MSRAKSFGPRRPPRRSTSCSTSSGGRRLGRLRSRGATRRFPAGRLSLSRSERVRPLMRSGALPPGRAGMRSSGRGSRSGGRGGPQGPNPPSLLRCRGGPFARRLGSFSRGRSIGAGYRGFNATKRLDATPILMDARRRLSKESPATTYSPRGSPPKYHRRWRSSLPCSEWERVFPRRCSHRNISWFSNNS